MRRFPSAYGAVSLTEERIQHILTFHPDMVRCMQYIAGALAKPEFVAQSVNDATVVICYRLIPRRKKYLAVVLKISKNPFVLTAYLAKKPKRDTL